MDIKVHPSALEGETDEERKNSKAFFVQVGLIREEDDFVADPTVADTDDEPTMSSDVNPCKTQCRNVYDIAKRACDLIPDGKKRKACRKKCKAAYMACLAICDLGG